MLCTRHSERKQLTVVSAWNHYFLWISSRQLSTSLHCEIVWRIEKISFHHGVLSAVTALAATLANTVQHLRCGREIPARLVTKDEIDYRTEPAHQRLAQRCLDWDQRENAAKFSKNPPNADPFWAEVLIEDLLRKSGPAHLQCSYGFGWQLLQNQVQNVTICMWFH